MMMGSCPWRNSSSSLQMASLMRKNWRISFTRLTLTTPTMWTPRSCVITLWTTWVTMRMSWPPWRP
uniref:Alternative protein NECAB2 n=1 Tax=Homo sapiens TaxID=9606 RepID=L8E8I4_HUMAN|nr:alternative protein NECAB2 [Homo sapiens]